jgi:hypothetical protein
MRTVVIDHITLDAVMQGPGRPDEDTRGGFGHGGWAEPGTIRQWPTRSRGDVPAVGETCDDQVSRLRLMTSAATASGVIATYQSG